MPFEPKIYPVNKPLFAFPKDDCVIFGNAMFYILRASGYCKANLTYLEDEFQLLEKTPGSYDWDRLWALIRVSLRNMLNEIAPKGSSFGIKYDTSINAFTGGFWTDESQLEPLPLPKHSTSYLLFCGNEDSPRKGWKDWRGQYPSEISALREAFITAKNSEFEWVQIVRVEFNPTTQDFTFTLLHELY